jgi:hypothetical protein
LKFLVTPFVAIEIMGVDEPGTLPNISIWRGKDLDMRINFV